MFGGGLYGLGLNKPCKYLNLIWYRHLAVPVQQSWSMIGRILVGGEVKLTDELITVLLVFPLSCHRLWQSPGRHGLRESGLNNAGYQTEDI